MPLIIHPSSCCDVCLEPLTYDEPRPPFAIPCGHIFCRECLHMMHPSICPLCRKPFIPDRSKKLITGEGEAEEDGTALALLQRLLVLWDRDTRDAEWISLVTEIDRWLNAGNIHEPLAKAYEILQAYHSLKAERHDNHRSMRQLRRELEQRAIAQMVEKEDATAIEQSLMSQIEELHSTILRYEEENEASRRAASTFRKAASTITFKDNPLPRPPQPYPLESLPSFARRYTNGYLTNGETHASTSRAAYEDQPASQSAIYLECIPIDRKGKGKAVLAPLALQNPNQSLSSPPSRTYQVDGESTGPKNAIIPGASPNQRFVPRSVFEDVPGAPWGSVSEVDRRLPVEEPPVPIDPYSMIEEYTTEYVDGYMEGYRSRHPPPASSSRGPRAPRSSTAGPAPIQSPLLEPPAEPRASSSRPPTSRPLTLGDFIGPAQDATSRSRDHRSSRRRRPPREDADSNDTTSAPPPVSAPVQLDLSSSSYSTASGAIDSSWWPRTHASTSGSTTTTAPLPAPTSAPAPPLSAPAQSSSFSITSASRPSWPSNSRASNSRSRPQRRLSDMTNIETTWRPPQTSPQPPSESASSLRRRSAFSAIPVQSGSVVHAPAASVSEADRASATSVILPLASAPQTPAGSASDRTSLSSWGTVNTANPAPPSTQPIQESAHFIPANDIVSVRDLRLRSFEDVDGVGSDRASVLSDLGSRSGRGATMPPVQREQSVGLHHDDSFNETPRNSMRSLSLHNSVPAVPERRRDSHTSSYQEPQFAPPPIAPEAWYRPDLVPTPAASVSSRHSYSNSTSSQHRSSRSNRRSSRPPSPPAAPYSEAPYSGPWTDAGYFTTAPATTSNALGLSDFAPSPEPQISAPTPVTSHRSFLRSFSHDHYN